MKFIESFVGAVQTNPAMNAIKNAIIKIAYVNIAVAVFIFIFAITNQNATLEISLLYQFYCIAIAVAMAYLVSEALTTPKQEHYRMFTALVVALIGAVIVPKGYATTLPLLGLFISVPLHTLMVLCDKIQFKSKTLPQAVLDYFNRLIPILCVSIVILAIIFLIPNLLIQLSEGILWVTGLASSIIAIILVILAICSFWILGIHGVGVIGTLMRPFWLHMMIVNGALILQNQPAQYIGSETFMQWAVWIGGSGCTIGLTILLRTMSKSTAMKSLGKDVLIPNLFNINENVVFGVPIVDNKHFRIPFFLAPLLCAITAYVAFAKAWVTVPAIVAPWVMPAPIGIFISTLGDFRSLILIAVLILISTLVYLPFFLAHDKELQASERS